MAETGEGEMCQRCGEVDTDRRTLWMACFYAMNEMDGVPFNGVQWEGITRTQIATEQRRIGTMAFDVPVYDEPHDTAPRTQHFYTLRVCKDCRADWMDAIARWFEERPERPAEDAIVPIRVNGATRMVTVEEYERMYPGRTPHTVQPTEERA